jgi:O-antigen ligase
MGAEFEAATAARVPALRRLEVTAPVALFAAALPVLFLHARFQPSFGSSLSSTQVEIRLSDLAVALIGVAALVAAIREGVEPLRHGRIVWLTGALFLGWVLAATFYPLVGSASYPWQTHLVTAVKYAEYAVIALAVPLVVRSLRDLLVVLWTLVAVSAAATAVALVQFFGVDILLAWPSGGRQPGFVGVDDLGALSAAAFAVALTVVAIAPGNRSQRALGWLAGVAGCLGLVLAGALASVLGALLAAGAAFLVAKRASLLDSRRALAIGFMALAVLAGSVFMRSSALGSFARFAGLGHEDNGRGVQSYSHRWVLDYVGLKIFLDHPVVGAGWQAGFDEAAYGPVLPAAHRRFPSQPAQAFPAPSHPWGIQSAYVEALAELGIVGAALFAAWVAAGFWVALRALRRPQATVLAPLLALLWLCVLVGAWNGIWFIGGIPFDALVWLAFGLAATPALLWSRR